MNIYIPSKRRIVNYGPGCTIYMDDERLIFEGAFGYPIILGEFSTKGKALYVFTEIMQQYSLNSKVYTMPNPNDLPEVVQGQI